MNTSRITRTALVAVLISTIHVATAQIPAAPGDPALDKQLAAAYLRALKDSDEGGQQSALHGLRQLKMKAAPEAIAGLAEFIRLDKRKYLKSTIRCNAFEVLGFMGPDAMPVLRELMGNERDPYFKGCYVAAVVRVSDALHGGFYGPGEGSDLKRPPGPSRYASTLRPGLIAVVLEAVKDPTSEKTQPFLETAVEALCHLPPPAIPQIIELTRHESPSVRAAAAGFFNYKFTRHPMGPSPQDIAAARQAIPALTGLLNDPDARVRQQAAQSLQNLQRATR